MTPLAPAALQTAAAMVMTGVCNALVAWGATDRQVAELQSRSEMPSFDSR